MISFIVPYRRDSPARAENLDIVRQHLRLAVPEGRLVLIEQKEKGFFHRTRLINEAVKQTRSSIIVVYDADVILLPEQYAQAVDYLEKGGDFCYPYSGKFIGVPRKFASLIRGDPNLVAFKKKREFFRVMNPKSDGGAIFFKREVYVAGGMENQRFRSWGYEDHERRYRFSKLGYQFKRIPGVLFHLSHPRGKDSSEKNPYARKNKREMKKVQNMSREKLEAYIKTWGWADGA